MYFFNLHNVFQLQVAFLSIELYTFKILRKKIFHKSTFEGFLLLLLFNIYSVYYFYTYTFSLTIN